MYSHCLFCRAKLGRNESLENFPVGRRLAYDQAKGRLWVVCRRCERWNLTPLEVRWEAMEEAERAFRATRLRVATDNIGLAQLPDGLDLVRIGKPHRVELAGWRYGDQFGRRRRKRFVYVGMGIIAPALPLLGSMGFSVGVSVVAMGAMLTHTVHDVRRTRRDMKVPTVFLADEAGRTLPLTVNDTWSAKLVPMAHSREWHLSVRHRHRGAVDADEFTHAEWRAREPVSKTTVLRGTAALRALATLMPHANAAGASTRGIREAVHEIERSSDLEGLIYAAAISKAQESIAFSSPLTRLPPRIRLALEMVLHEEEERQALEGELAVLERRWREAEEIAGIADTLLVSSEIEARLESLRLESNL